MAEAKNGDSVKVHYTGKLDDGTVFDTSAEREPLLFTVGEGKLIPDFEQAVVGMNPGESKTIQVPSGNAYGPHRKEMIMVVEQNQFPPELKLEVGQQLQVRQQDGSAFVVKVTEIAESGVTLDGNHPLAGKDLTFDIELTEIC